MTEDNAGQAEVPFRGCGAPEHRKAEIHARDPSTFTHAPRRDQRIEAGATPY
jgi:hypothetical protein